MRRRRFYLRRRHAFVFSAPQILLRGLLSGGLWIEPKPLPHLCEKITHAATLAPTRAPQASDDD
jgi:hypothetical protein